MQSVQRDADCRPPQFGQERTLNEAMLYALRHNQSMTTEPRKRFSMIREFHFADWFTLGNAVCGTGALFSSMTYLQTDYP